MNERIKKLANIWANRRADYDTIGIGYLFSELALQKFAEEIVRECSHLIETRDPRNDPAEYIHVLKAFGVKND